MQSEALRVKMWSSQLLPFLKSPCASGIIAFMSAHMESLCCKICVNSFNIELSDAIGRKLLGTLLSPFLNIITVSAILQLSGVNSVWKISCIYIMTVLISRLYINIDKKWFKSNSWAKIIETNLTKFWLEQL